MATRTAASMFDQQALIQMMAEASAKQTAQVRQAVHDATIRALQGREMTMQNVRSTLKAVTQATQAGAAKSGLPKADLEAMLESAVAGMDDAMLRAVEAQRLAVDRMIEQGVTMQDQVMQKAIDSMEKMEDALIKAVHQAASGANANLGGAWQGVIDKLNVGGTATGANATDMVEQLTTQMQTAMRQSRAAGMQAAALFSQSWGALVSGVLIGMSDAMKAGRGKKG